MADQFLSDVIDYERDIAPYRFIQIYSGVGSGKNRWIQKQAEEGKRILLITSRQITADAQAKKLGADRWIDLDKLLDRADRELECLLSDVTHCVVCTNSGFAEFVCHKFSPEDSRTYLWNKFDLIVLDECHSLATDATFVDAPFHVEKFIHFAIKQQSKCRFIFMTGTLSPVKWLLDDQGDRVHIADFFDVCRHITPDKVDIIPKTLAKRKVLSLLRENSRVIVFVNTIDSMKSWVDHLNRNGISDDDIGLLYAKDEDGENFTPELVDTRKKLIEYLEAKEYLLPSVKILLTTSKGKEGININDEDIPCMFCESHYSDDLVQMAGRVRNGLDTLFVIRDARQNYNALSLFAAEINRDCAETVNGTRYRYEAYCEENNLSCPETDMIKTVEKMFACVRYSYISKRFEVYEGKIHGIREYAKGIRNFSEYIEHWSDPVNQAGNCGGQLLQRWFPYSTITLYGGIVPSDEAVKAVVEDFLLTHNYLDRQIQRQDADAIKAFINGRFERYGNRIAGMSLPIRNLGAALKHIGFRTSRCGRNGSGQVMITYGVPDEAAEANGTEIDL